MGAFKQLHTSDITVIPYTANKKWSLTYNNTPNDGYITYYTGTNVPFSVSGTTTTNGEYQSSIYALVNQLYYQSYTGSLNTQSLASSIYYESASEQRATSSYYQYDGYGYIANFPSESGNQIGFLGISSDLYSNNILPYTFQISSSLIVIVDDGLGNLFDITYLPTMYMDGGYVNPYYALSAGYITSSYFTASYINEEGSEFIPIHVGNIFYGHGTCVITDSNYINFLNSPILPINVEFRNNYTIQENEVRCIVKEGEFNASYNPSIQAGIVTSASISSSVFYFNDGTLRDFATGSDFSPYVTSLGLYNDEDDLLAVAKFAKPLLISPNTDMTFIVRYDI
jgi:hypothetical protein